MPETSMRSRQSIWRTGVEGRLGAVAAAREASAAAAEEMLSMGGNAMDAAVAAAFVAGVIEPMETTLAGSGFLLVALPQGETRSIEFGPRAPLGARPDMFRIDTERSIDRGLGVSMVVGDENVQGIRAAGVPATLAGLCYGLEHYGRLPLATVMAPAIRAAHDGFAADSYFVLEALDHWPSLQADPGARRLFLPHDGRPPACAHLGATTLGRADVIRQAALGRSLEQIAERGVECFYDGELGDRLLQTHRDFGGLLTREDLLTVRPKAVVPRRMRFRDHEIWAPWAPCGAITEFQILSIWQALYPNASSTDVAPERLAHLAQAGWHAFADRYHWLGDPEFVPVPEQGLLSPAYIRSIADEILGASAPPRSPAGDLPWSYFAGHAVHDPRQYDPIGVGMPAWTPAGGTEPTAGTTHVSVVDRQGMAVSLTHTAANHCGAKLVCERTGFLLDATMGWFNACPGAANSIAPGKRPLANMGPVLLTRDQRAVAAIGAPGGRRIIHAVVQVVLNLVEHGMSPEQALQAPRIDASGTSLLVSERLSAEVPGLSDRHGPVLMVEEQHQGYSYELARPLVALYEGGCLRAAADPYSRGYARGIL